MVVDRSQIIDLFRKMELFLFVSGGEIALLVDRFEQVSLQPDQSLFSGRGPEDTFYIIFSGRIYVDPGTGEAKDQTKTLARGEYFGEETLLYGQPSTAVIKTDTHTELLRLDGDQFYQMLREFPAVKPGLARTAEARHLVHRNKFDWLGADEVIYYLARKHEVILLFSLVGPLLVFMIALALISAVSFSESSTTIFYGSAGCSSLLALAAILWGVWIWVDWGNDYYIVTDQRVVWVEKVIWLYESRDEAPLNTILSVNVSTTFFGRILHYGDVIVKTFTGQIIFRRLKAPYKMADFIEEYRQRLSKRSERVEKREIDQAIRQRLGMPKEGTPPGILTGGETEPEKESFWQKNFGNFFAMRFEKGNVITFRKYWPTLLGKVWIPSLLIILALMGMSALTYWYQIGQIELSWFQILEGLLFLLVLLVFVPWWIYQYVDWRNDIYQVTDKFIFDIEKKPLGTEVKKSAPLENILSLEHRRVGFLGYVLNFGSVTINVGETRFIFHSVHEPARVQQDIFNRIHALRQQKEQAEAGRKREQLVDVLEIYHRNAEEYREGADFNAYEEDEYDEFEVE